jgi:hypothetical protein
MRAAAAMVGGTAGDMAADMAGEATAAPAIALEVITAQVTRPAVTRAATMQALAMRRVLAVTRRRPLAGMHRCPMWPGSTGLPRRNSREPRTKLHTHPQQRLWLEAHQARPYRAVAIAASSVRPRAPMPLDRQDARRLPRLCGG